MVHFHHDLCFVRIFAPPPSHVIPRLVDRISSTAPMPLGEVIPRAQSTRVREFPPGRRSRQATPANAALSDSKVDRNGGVVDVDTSTLAFTGVFKGKDEVASSQDFGNPCVVVRN